MSNEVEKVKAKLFKLFEDIKPDLDAIIEHSSSTDDAIEKIRNLVSSRVVESTRTYLPDLFYSLSDETLKDPIFQSSENKNKFYDLKLDKKMLDACRLDVKSVKSMTNHDINLAYGSAVTAVGSAAICSILFGVISGTVNIPVAIVVAGAVLIGLCGGIYGYYKVIPNMNKKRLKENTNEMLNNLKVELNAWVNAVVDFYNQQIDALKKTL